MTAEIQTSAVFSEDRRYRYELIRDWDRSRPRCAFVLLNPSTADEANDDPTIRRCMGFARAWGFGSIRVLNIFALRSTDPKALRKAIDPIGPDNDEYLASAHLGYIRIVAGWGEHGRYMDRGRAVLRMFRLPYAFGLTASGQPKHPLYLSASAEVHPIENFRRADRYIAAVKAVLIEPDTGDT